MALDSSPGPDVTLALHGKQATHISLLLTAFASSVVPLSTAHELLFSFLSISPPYICSPYQHLPTWHCKTLGGPVYVFS